MGHVCDEDAGEDRGVRRREKKADGAKPCDHWKENRARAPGGETGGGRGDEKKELTLSRGAHQHRHAVPECSLAYLRSAIVSML